MLAQSDLKRYQLKGPNKTTRILLKMLKTYDLSGASLLDIGSGIGVVSLELCADGLARAVLIDMASAYLNVAKAEAQR